MGTRRSRWIIVMCRTACVVLASLLLACSSSDEGSPRPIPTSPTVPTLPTPPTPLPPVPPGVGGVFVAAPMTPPSSATDPTVGRYRLALAVGSSCESFPEVTRHRTYTADIDSTGATTYAVTLYDASFLHSVACHDLRFSGKKGPVCNQFLASRVEDSLLFDFLPHEDDNWTGNIIYEQLPDSPTWIEMEGSATGRLQNGAIMARGRITQSYWLGSPGRSSYSVCRSEDLSLNFTRR